jgi:hypothetical protein
MRLEARFVDKWHYKGQWATELVYAVLADEWRAVLRPGLAKTAVEREGTAGGAAADDAGS